MTWWMIPRKPTEEEYLQLFSLEWERQYGGSKNDPKEEETLRAFIRDAAIAVFDGYITDGPGYVGKIMVVVWTGSPTFYEAYTWNMQTHRIRVCKQEF